MLLLLILLSHSRWGKAESEAENGTLRAEEVPRAEADPTEAPEIQGEGTPGDENGTLTAEEVPRPEAGPSEEPEVQGEGTPEPSAGPLGIAPGNQRKATLRHHHHPNLKNLSPSD